MTHQDPHLQHHSGSLNVTINGHGTTTINFGHASAPLHSYIHLAARKLRAHVKLGTFYQPGDYRMHYEPEKCQLSVILLNIPKIVQI